MQLNSLGKSKTQNSKMSKWLFVGLKKSATLPPPRDGFVTLLSKTPSPPRHVIYGRSLISIYFSINIKQKYSKITAFLQKSVSYNCIPPSQVTQHTSRTIFQKINISKTDYNESLPKRRFCRRNKIPYKIQWLRRWPPTSFWPILTVSESKSLDSTLPRMSPLVPVYHT